jgi:hypothetical protein
MITIAKDEYYDLKVAQAELNLLECAGVDNWEGYCDALNNEFGDMDYSLDEIKETLHNEIFGVK